MIRCIGYLSWPARQNNLNRFWGYAHIPISIFSGCGMNEARPSGIGWASWVESLPGGIGQDSGCRWYGLSSSETMTVQSYRDRLSVTSVSDGYLAKF